mmetsp:Transcript_18957/g.60169  ORF Transcript_18957/g.60169 Transcript_18957/m.60169 type:complete len:230 (-) Transcript_18957:122-811(-)
MSCSICTADSTTSPHASRTAACMDTLSTSTIFASVRMSASSSSLSTSSSSSSSSVASSSRIFLRSLAALVFMRCWKRSRFCCKCSLVSSFISSAWSSSSSSAAPRAPRLVLYPRLAPTRATRLLCACERDWRAVRSALRLAFARSSFSSISLALSVSRLRERSARRDSMRETASPLGPGDFLMSTSMTASCLMASRTATTSLWSAPRAKESTDRASSRVRDAASCLPCL